MQIVSETVLTDIKAKLVDMSKTWTASVTMGEAYELNGTYKAGKGYNACHAWLTNCFRAMWTNGHYDWSSPYTSTAKNFILATAHSKVRSKGICSPEAHEAIIKWMVTDENPLSVHILNRDDEDSLLNGGLIVLCGPDGATCSEAMWMCKVLRYGVEAGQALDVWHKLVQGGVNPLIALFVSTYVRTVRGATFGFSGQEGHSSVFYAQQNHREDTYHLTYDPAELLNPVPNPKATCTSEVFFHKTTANKFMIPFKKFCQPVKIDDGWGGKVDGNAASQAQFITNVLEWQNSLGKGPVRKVIERVIKPKLPGKKDVYLEMDL